MKRNRFTQSLSRPVRVLLLSGALVLTACTPASVVAGAGASAGVATAEERGFSGATRDARIRLEINDLWFQKDVEMVSNVALQIYEGRVLLSGLIATQEMADDAVRLAWQPEGVREVINEMRISESGGIEAFARDSLINARLDAALLLDSKIRAINYSTRAVAGTVYLLGIAQNQGELDRVFDITRNTPDVRSVISHVILKTDPRRKQSIKPAPGNGRK